MLTNTSLFLFPSLTHSFSLFSPSLITFSLSHTLSLSSLPFPQTFSRSFVFYPLWLFDGSTLALTQIGNNQLFFAKSRWVGSFFCVSCGCSTTVERTSHDQEFVGSNPVRCWDFLSRVSIICDQCNETSFPANTDLCLMNSRTYRNLSYVPIYVII